MFLLAESLVEQFGMEFRVTLVDVKRDSLRYCLQQIDLCVSKGFWHTSLPDNRDCRGVSDFWIRRDQRSTETVGQAGDDAIVHLGDI